jgi:drug/metabolite transporter (DMT)-like permease
MENKMLLGVGIILLSNLVAAVSQLLLKQAAKKTWPNWWRSFLNVRIILAYGLFFATTLFSVYALRFIPLSLSAALGASGQIFVPLLSRLVLHEKISKQRALGMLIIVAGIVVFSL